MLSLSKHLYQNSDDESEDNENNNDLMDKSVQSSLDAQMFDECGFATAKRNVHNTAMIVSGALRSRLASSDKAHNKLV